MTGYMIGRILGRLLAPLIIMAITAGIYCLITRVRKPFLKVMFSRWNVLAGVVILILSAIGQFVHSR